MSKKKKSKKNIIILIVVLVIVALAVVGYIRMSANLAEAAKTTYDIVDVTKGTIEVKVKGAGTVEPMSDDTVYADAASTVKDVLFENGDAVSADDIIAVLESDALDSEKSSIEQQIDELDMSILTARSTSGSKNVVSSIEGVVKAVYAKEGESVDAVMERDGALAIVCPDDLMKTVVPYENALAPGDAATVTVGTQSVNGVVVSTSGGKATVQFEDSDFALGDTAVVTDANSSEIGSGTVAVANPVYVSAQGGTVDDVRVEVGDDVSRGGKLLALDGEILSSSLYSQLEQRESLRGDLDDILADIDGLSVRAGTDGVITGLSLKKGQPVQQGVALFTVQSSNAVKIDVEIDELDIADIEMGDAVTVTFDALPEKTYTADIIKINPVGVAKNNVTKYTTTLSLEGAQDVLLGMSADVQIVSQQVQNARLIPVEAIQVINGEKFVVFEQDVDEDLMYTPATHKVMTGITDGVNIEVTEGLSEGDRVAVPQVKEKSLQEQMWSRGGTSGNSFDNNGGDESPSGSSTAVSQ